MKQKRKYYPFITFPHNFHHVEAFVPMMDEFENPGLIQIHRLWKSHIGTVRLSSSSNFLPPSNFFMSPDKWKSEGRKSGDKSTYSTAAQRCSFACVSPSSGKITRIQLGSFEHPPYSPDLSSLLFHSWFTSGLKPI